jgi:hypothetical protein
MYWKYFCYIINHKWNVFIECIKEGFIIHAITHDLSKFRPSEFIPYAKFFFKNNDEVESYNKLNKNEEQFQKAWFLHQHRNKHHWNYWISVSKKTDIIPVPMPKKYVVQMICDWRGMARKFNDSAFDYYNKNKGEMILHKDTKGLIDFILEK